MRIRINRLLTSRGRGGLEGARPSSSPEYHFLSEVRISASALTASRRSRNFPPRYCFHLPGRSGGRPALQLPRASFSLGCSASNPHPARGGTVLSIFTYCRLEKAETRVILTYSLISWCRFRRRAKCRRTSVTTSMARSQA